ncbi:MAG: S49 family peptidase [Prevotellaceae bacterium]|jgi:protease-4|nr:S49 family peptidase [Prevotellaceae bacterium]
MQFSFIKELIESSWAINAITMQIYAPVLRGVFNGLQFERENPDEKYMPFCVNRSGVNVVNENEECVFVQPVRGILMKNTTESGTIGTRLMAERLLTAEKNKSVIGHILVFESGGGQTAAVPELTDAIQKCKKPVVAWVDGLMCSAAMYIGSYCQQIIASRETDNVGCIGVMIELGGFPKFNKMPDGYTSVRIYADGSEEKNDEYEAALTGDFKLVKERILNPACVQFINDIKTNRPNAKDEHLKGKTFFASEVVGILIDAIGDFQTAVDAVWQLHDKNKNHNPINMERQLNIAALLAVLAVTELACEDGNTSFNEEQLEAINEALEAGNRAQTELATANTNLQQVNATLAERDATIATLQQKIAEMEKKPGDNTASVNKETDGNSTPTVSIYDDVLNTLKRK